MLLYSISSSFCSSLFFIWISLKLSICQSPIKLFQLEQTPSDIGNNVQIQKVINQDDLNQNFPLFSQVPIYQFGLQTLCPNNQIAQISDILPLHNQENQHLVFIAIRNCGVAMLDTTDIHNFNTKWFQQYSEYITTLVLSSNETLLWMGMENYRIIVMNIEDKSNIIQDAIIPMDQLIYKFIFSSNEEIMYAAGLYQIQVYNVKDRQNPKLIQSTPQKEEKQQAFISIMLAKQDSFLFTANDENGISIYSLNKTFLESSPQVVNKQLRIIKQSPLKYLCSIRMSWSSAYDIKIIQDQYLYVLEVLSGLFQVDLSKFWQTQDCSSLEITDQMDFASETTSMLINENSFQGPYLFMGVRSQGIMIISLNNPKDFVIFEQIYVNGLALKIQLSSDNNQIYYSNGISLLVYQRSKPNFNLMKPNILNDYQTVFLPNSLFGIYDNWSWRCAYSNGILFQARSREGNVALQLKNKGYNLEKLSVIIQSLQSKGTGVNGIKILKDQRHVILGLSSSGVAVIDYSDPKNPNTLFQSTFDFNDNDSDSIHLNDAETLMVVASGKRGVLIINTTNLKKLTLISNFFLQDFKIVGTCEDALLTSDSQYVFATVREYGLLLIDITEIQTPQLKYKLLTLGAESILYAQKEKYLILSNGYRGIMTLDIQDKNNIKVMGQIYVEGQCLHIRSLFNDQFILVTLQEKGQLALVDITSIEKPVLIQRYQYLQEDIAYDVCLNEDQSIAYIMGRTGTVILPIKSEIILHTEMFEINIGSDGKVDKRQLSQLDILQVGMKVQFEIVPIFSTHKLLFKKCFFYNSYKYNELPTWISFQQATQQLKLTITKESLEEDTENGILGRTLHQLIFIVYQEIKDEDFINLNYNIDLNFSKQIKQLCSKQGIIDNVNFITDQFNPYVQFSLEGFTGTFDQQQYINLILKKKMINYPIYFTTDTSLILNMADEKNVVQSYSSSVQMYITIDSNKGRFVDIKYKGALVSLSQDSSTIMLEGDKKQVNQVIVSGFLIQTDNNPSTIKIRIKLNDWINYELEQTFNFEEVKFLNLLDKIKVNPQFTLQDDFNDQFEDGIIYCSQSFKFQINDIVFINKSSQKSVYQLNILIGDQYVELPKKHWLSFNTQTNTLSGVPSFQMSGETIRIQINATDTYSYVVDNIVIKIEKGPATIFLQIFLGILVPLVVILIIHHFKSNFYNILFTKNFTHSTEVIEIVTMAFVIIIGKEYTKQIILYDEIFRVAKIIWEQYKKKIDNKAIHSEITHLKNRKDDFNISNSVSLMNKVGILQQNNQNENNNSQQVNKSNNIEQINTFQPIADQAGVTDLALQEQEPTSKKAQQNNNIGTQMVLDSNYRFFYYNGEVKKDYILKTMAIFFDQLNHTHPQLSINQRITSEDIIDTSSKISKILMGFFTIHCLNLDSDCIQIFEKLKALALTKYNNLDWYKAYVLINSDLDDVSDNSIPLIYINEFELGKTIQILQQSSTFKMWYHLFLIKDAILCTAYGFQEKKGGWRQRSFGETIYQSSQKISCIKIYQKVKNNRLSSKSTQFSCFRDLDFKQCPQSINYGLPLWMNTLEIINGTIIISGQPLLPDIGQYLIKIFDQNHYILREYKISVIKKELFTHDNSQHLLGQKINQIKLLTKQIPKQNIKHAVNPNSSNLIFNPSQHSVNGNLFIKENQEEQTD